MAMAHSVDSGRGSLNSWSSVKNDSSSCGDRARGKEWGTT
jgi:hypothetical protein